MSRLPNNKLIGYEPDESKFFTEFAKNTGDTDLQVEKYVCADDPRMNYTFIKPENIEKQKPKLPEVIARDLFDYGVVIKKGEEEDIDNIGTLDTVVPISYAQIKNPQQGEEWYRAKYPDLPEDFYGIIARYTWGAPFTKKEVKNTVKKIKKKNKKEVPQGFSMVKGNFELDFN
mgnify:CR=1 FL=1|tara:strand:+ start:2672 stop:3190 length:519 start_codon:yes stop_codon:yes gene_type:complete